MTKHPIAILVIFQNEPEKVERVLSQIYTQLEPVYDLYVIDDSSEDNTPRVIESVIKKFNHDFTFFFENPTPLGRKRSIREILQIIDNNILWTPTDFDTELQNLIKLTSIAVGSALNELVYTNSGGDATPTEAGEISKSPAVGSESADEPSAVNVLQTGADDKAAGSIAVVDVASVTQTTSDINTKPLKPWTDKRKKRSTTAPDELKHPLSNKFGFYQPEKSSSVAKEVFNKLKTIIDQQDHVAATKELETAIAAHPTNKDLNWIKIILLEHLGYYVQAAELRYQIQLEEQELPPTRIRRESTVIAFPIEENERLQDIQVDPKTPEPVLTALKTDVSDLILTKINPISAASVEVDLLDETQESTFEAEQVEEVDESEALEPIVMDESAETEHDFIMDESHEVEQIVMDESAETEHDFIMDESHEVEQIVVDEPEPVEQAVVADYSPGANNVLESAGDEIEEPEKEVMLDDSPEPDIVSDSMGDDAPEAGQLEFEITETPLSEFVAKKESVHESPPAKPRKTGSTSVSVIIPTAVTGLPVLKNAINSLAIHANHPNRNLIIVDNGSLDGTPGYLKGLISENFMNLRVITNPTNMGFSHAVNQALKHAKSDYVLIMHNDVTLNNDAISQLAQVLDENEHLTMVGPLAESVFNEAQLRKPTTPDNGRYKKVPYIDSVFMLIRRTAIKQFDENYGLSWFDDIDYGMSITSSGGQAAIVPSVNVNHVGSYTLSALGRDPYDQQFWKNASYFETKWNQIPSLPNLSAIPDDIHKLVAISQIMNPFYPEKHFIEAVNQLFTSELRTQILTRDHSSETSLALIRLMIVLNQRDVLRKLEEKLDISEIDDFMIFMLIDFYYNKQIYSRCIQYLEKLPSKRRYFRLRVLQVRIFVASNEIEKATELLTDLMKEKPTHPGVLKIASDMHRKQTNQHEANEFLKIASQVDPISYPSKH